MSIFAIVSLRLSIYKLADETGGHFDDIIGFCVTINLYMSVTVSDHLIINSRVN